MGRPRSFDWDEAVRLRTQGLSYAEIGRLLGVSRTSAQKACDPGFRKRQYRSSTKRILLAMEPCRGGCGVLVFAHQKSRPRTGYCVRCSAERRRFIAEMRDNHGTQTRYSLGCRCIECRRAATEAKRLRRDRSRMPCSHGCGTTVVSINRGDPSKPLECQACANRRIRAERKARRAVAV